MILSGAATTAFTAWDRRDGALATGLGLLVCVAITVWQPSARKLKQVGLSLAGLAAGAAFALIV